MARQRWPRFGQALRKVGNQSLNGRIGLLAGDSLSVHNARGLKVSLWILRRCGSGCPVFVPDIAGVFT